MMYVALIEGVALIATALSFAGIVRWLVRQQARERELLVNQVCSLAGRPWREPPSWHPEPVPEDDLELLVASPEQWPE